MKICDYGCGQEATYQLKNGKWCCSKSYNSCSIARKNNSQANMGIKNHFYKKKHSEETREQISKSHKGKILSTEHKEKIGKSVSGEKNGFYGKIHSKETRKKISKANKGRKHSKETKLKWKESRKGIVPWNKGKRGLYKCSEETKRKISKIHKGKKYSQEILEKMSISSKLTISKIKKRYLFFSKIEEMRYNPDNPGEKEIQVHCKNHKCENSKENNGWFTPTYIQLYERIRQLEKDYGNGGCYFYCSDECKNICPLYGLRFDPHQTKDLPYTQEEYNVWKLQVRELDNSTCQFCGSTENIHVHHIKPVKLEPMFSLDPDYGICLCEECHYQIGHKSRTECSTGTLANQICK